MNNQPYLFGKYNMESLFIPPARLQKLASEIVPIICREILQAKWQEFDWVSTTKGLTLDKVRNIFRKKS